MNSLYSITDDTLEQIKKSITNPDNKLVQLASIKVQDIKERYIKLEMPLSDVHVNHVGTAYAISMLMLMEVAGASLIRATYGFDTYNPIIKKMEVEYLRPTTKNLICELSITNEDAKEKISYIEQNGKGNFILPILLKDSENEEIAKANIVFYLIAK